MSARAACCRCHFLGVYGHSFSLREDRDLCIEVRWGFELFQLRSSITKLAGLFLEISWRDCFWLESKWSLVGGLRLAVLCVVRLITSRGHCSLWLLFFCVHLGLKLPVCVKIGGFVLESVLVPHKALRTWVGRLTKGPVATTRSISYVTCDGAQDWVAAPRHYSKLPTTVLELLFVFSCVFLDVLSLQGHTAQAVVLCQKKFVLLIA